MSIFTTLYSIPNHDRFVSWDGAYRYLKQAEPLFQVKARNRINLLRHRNEQQQSGPRLVLQVALAALGWVGLLALAFGLLVVLGAVMGVV